MLENSLCNGKYADNIDIIDPMIDALGIVDDESGMPPISDEERATVKLQLLVAQILVRDVVLMRMKTPAAHDDSIIDELAGVFAANVADIAKEILRNDIFKLNVLDVLKDFNAKI